MQESCLRLHVIAASDSAHDQRQKEQVKQAVLPCQPEDVKDALLTILQELDEPAPVWLGKHDREMSEFRRTTFSKGDFMESVSFDRMEMELLDEEGVRRRSTDPRNAD